MKKIDENIILYILVQFIVMTVAAMIIWPLFDILYDKVITNSTFHYSVTNHIIRPIIFGAIIAVIQGILKKRNDKKKIEGEENEEN